MICYWLPSDRSCAALFLIHFIFDLIQIDELFIHTHANFFLHWLRWTLDFFPLPFNSAVQLVLSVVDRHDTMFVIPYFSFEFCQIRGIYECAWMPKRLATMNHLKTKVKHNTNKYMHFYHLLIGIIAWIWNDFWWIFSWTFLSIYRSNHHFKRANNKIYMKHQNTRVDTFIPSRM